VTLNEEDKGQEPERGAETVKTVEARVAVLETGKSSKSTTVNVRANPKRFSIDLDGEREESYIERRYCTICHVEQPLRTKHCVECNKCCATYDHHCPWLGTCIAEYNHGLFYWYLWLELLELSATFAYVINPAVMI
jgi:hypothetical protein